MKLTPEAVRTLLDAVAAGSLSSADAQLQLGSGDETDLGFAVVDHHRAVRLGLPEVIFGEGKEAEHVIGIARAQIGRGHNVLVTRLDADKQQRVADALPGAIVNRLARTVRVVSIPRANIVSFRVAVVCAGTSDLPVLEECCETLEACAIAYDRVTDVGVAGIHRLFSRMEVLRAANAVIVIAGMEGALPSVVGGLIASPVIAVPTSVGYGVGAGGIAALLGMLTSCASGITVCNVDNGFGAAMAVHRIARSNQA